MTGFYCLPEPRIWRGKRLREATEGPQTDPYGPDQPGYRVRARETATDIGNGMVRVDIGEPIRRVHGAAQPVPCGAPEEPPPPPTEPTAPLTIAAASKLTEVASRDWRGNYGLAKRG